MRRIVRIAVVHTAAAALLLATAGTSTAKSNNQGIDFQSDSPSRPVPGTKPSKFVVEGHVNRVGYSAKTKKTTATAEITGTVTDGQSGQKTAVTTRATLSATAKGSCKVLHLTLEELRLNLLGLNAFLDRVELDVTGDKKGGVLGQLFCRLSSGVDLPKLKRHEAISRANKALNGRPLRLIRVRVPIRPVYYEGSSGGGSGTDSGTADAQTAQTPPQICPVLNLVVGPLDLNLLGLIVNLNKVKLDITATRGGGAVGNLFCRLYDGT
jgi:hypothetical protein